jgi:hypothetical protein
MQEQRNHIIPGDEDPKGIPSEAATAETLAGSYNPFRNSDRRLDPRRQVSSIMYVQLGEHNGGVILNISEGGLAVQAAMALVDNVPPLRFQLSAHKWVQASARIVWLAQSKRTAGLQFNDLSETARAEIRGWLGLELGDTRPRAEKRPSNFDAVPQDVIAHGQDDLTDKSQQDSLPPSQLEASLQNLAASVSSGRGLSGSRQRNELPGELANELMSPERPYSATLHTAQALPARVIAARLRRYLVDERHKIRLYDLVFRQTASVCTQLTEANFPATAAVTVEEFLTRIHRYEELSEGLLSIMATGCFWGDGKLDSIWPKIIEQIATSRLTKTGAPQWVSLRLYPALLLLYIGGLAAIAKGNYSALAALLLQPKLKNEDGNYSLIEQLYASSVIGDERFRNALCGATQYKLPVSAYLYAFLRERLREFIPSDIEYSAVFDRFEYVLALVWTDQNPNSTRTDWIPVGGPLGLFASKTVGCGEASVFEQLDQELSDLGKNYPVLRSGIFGGSVGRLRSASQRVAAQIQLERNNLAQARAVRGDG